MTLSLFVGVGINHVSDSVPFIQCQLDKHKPDIVTLETSLNADTFAVRPRTSYELDKDHEWSQIAKVVIDQGIPYCCIDGNTDPNGFPYFTNVEMASRYVWPKRDGNNYYPQPSMNHMYYIAIERSTEDNRRDMVGRNEFMAEAIALVVERYRPRTLLHVSGTNHFRQIETPEDAGLYRPLQDMVLALSTVVFVAATGDRLRGADGCENHDRC